MIIGMVPMGRGPRRRWRAKCASWPRGDRWAGFFATFATLFFVPCVFFHDPRAPGAKVVRAGAVLTRDGFENFRTGSESRDGGHDGRAEVQMDAVDREQPRGKGSRIFTILFLIVIVLVVLGALTFVPAAYPVSGTSQGNGKHSRSPTVAVFSCFGGVDAGRSRPPRRHASVCRIADLRAY